ncbi:hypothetical protein [Roseateles sp.]|uniref:hypothetical protein n=1 Tax=Roseateles sp. TaxID=1971397 RepID=UPI00395D0725
MRITPFLFPLLLSSAAIAQPAGDDPWKFGALRFGMSTQEARAATPGVEWKVLAGAPSPGIAYEIKASQLLELGGLRHDVRVGSRYGGTHHWEISTAAVAASVADCKARTAALVTELESRFGMFDLTAALVGAEKAVQVGKASRMKTVAGRGLFFVRSQHARTSADDLDIMVSTDFDENRGRQCNISARLDAQSPPPKHLNVSWDPARVIARPTIAYRNRSLRALGVPPQPLTVLVPCNIQASNGRIGSCLNGPAGQPIDPFRKLASDWALRYQLDIGTTDPQDQTVYPIDLPITISNDDVRDVDLESGTVLDLAQVKVVRNGRRDAADYLPNDPQLRQMSADIAVRCKVLEDGSMICGLKPGTTSPAEGFTLAAIQFCESLEIDPKLRDGSSAVGGFVERRLQFRSQASK